MPYKAAYGMTYDSGEFTAVLDKALALADWNGFAARKAESRKRGLLRGRGIGDYLEVTAPPANEMGGIRFEADGGVTIITGTLDYGQGHGTPFAQVLHQKLGIPFERIRLLQGDSDELIAGGGTGGSKSLMASGTAIISASEKVIAQGKQMPRMCLRPRLPISSSRAAASSSPAPIALSASWSWRRCFARPATAGRIAPNPRCPACPRSSLSAFPNGVHIAEVEIDPETGVVAVVKYSMVNDFG